MKKVVDREVVPEFFIKLAELLQKVETQPEGMVNKGCLFVETQEE